MSTDDRFGDDFRNPDDEGIQMLGTTSLVMQGPVGDYATDFDHTAEEWTADPFPIMDDLRERCPVAHTERYGGGWLPTKHEDVAAVAYDTEHFSSRSPLMSNNRPPLEMAPFGIAPPISSDPPFHHDARRLLLPAFSPKAIASLEESTRAYCYELLDAMGDRPTVDAAIEYSQHIPVRVIADMLGMPNEDADLHRQFVKDALESVNETMETRLEMLGPLFEYLRNQIMDHVDEPRDDLISFLIDAEIGGTKLDPFLIGGFVALLLLAGIDTTWSAIGASIWHLAGNAEDRQKIVDDPDLLPTALEEFLRAYAPVTMARLVKEDFDFNGCPMKAEDWVLLSFPSANRDPEVFERADEVLIDREANRHSAFGLGIHRCIGSNLARLEMRVALECWLDRFPDFELADADAVRWSGGQVRGPRVLPIKINRSVS